MTKKYILLTEEMEVVVKEVEVLKEVEAEEDDEKDRTLVWIPSKEVYQRAKLVDRDSLHDTREDAIKEVISMHDRRIKEMTEEKEKWEDKLN